MRTTKYYKVLPSVAERSGVAEMRYRTSDGMIILNEQDVRMIRLEPEEYLTGVVEAILTEEEALLLIEQGGKQMGLPPEETGNTVPENGITDIPVDADSDMVTDSEEMKPETESGYNEAVDEPIEEPSETGVEENVKNENGTEETIKEEVSNE